MLHLRTLSCPTRRSSELVDVERAKLLAPLERGQLDCERQAGDLAAQAAHELDRAHHRPTSGQQVVDDEDSLPLLDRVLVDLERGGAVLERVLDRKSTRLNSSH